MEKKIITLKKIFGDEGLRRILTSVNHVGIIEYDELEMPYSKAFASALSELGVDSNIIKEVVYIGKHNISWGKGYANQIRDIFPSSIVGSATSYDKCPNLRQTLTIHFLNGLETNKLDDIKKSIRKNNYFYTISIYVKSELTGRLFENFLLDFERQDVDIDIITDIDVLHFDEPENAKELSDYCRDRQKSLQTLLDNGYSEAAFNQCLAEVPNGCEECSLCSSYGKRKLCPYFQKKIGDFYKDGIFVPENTAIADQWYSMSAKQGYKPACMCIADSTSSLFDQSKSVELLEPFANKGDQECVDRLLSIANSSRFPAIAAHYAVKMANDNSNSIIWKQKVAQFFESGEWGFPIDPTRREEWELKSAENGNAEVIQTIAERYYNQENWGKALYWYNRLKNEVEDADLDDIIDSITCNAIREENLSPLQIAEKGFELYYGWNCTQDIHSSFLYFQTAAESEEALAYAGLACYYENSNEEGGEVLALYNREKAAYAGHIESMIYMLYYEDEECWDYWHEKIIESINQGVLEGDKYAMLAQARCFVSGEVFPQDEVEAYALYKEIADRFIYPEACLKTGEFLLEGKGTPVDKSKGYYYIEKAATIGVLEAQYLIGLRYENNWWSATSFEWFKKAAERGHAGSQYKLYQYFKYGRSVPKNLHIANQWCLKAAKQGNAEAQETIGENYFNGDGIEKDYVQARIWTCNAVTNGRNSAKFRLAWMASHGLGGPRDYQEAFKLYKDRAENGSAVSMNNLACMYADGQGTTRNVEEAARWYLAAAEHGDGVAQCNIANYYKAGTGVEKNIDTAIFWFEKSISNGYSYAAYFLAQIYKSDEYYDIDKAITCYEKAISMPHEMEEQRRGYDPSIIALADLYYDGIEVEEDNDKAFSLYKKAAELNIVRAFVKLGHCYRYGYGTAEDRNQAIYWYRKAAEKNYQEAKDALDEMHVPYLNQEEIDDLPF